MNAWWSRQAQDLTVDRSVGSSPQRGVSPKAMHGRSADAAMSITHAPSYALAVDRMEAIRIRLTGLTLRPGRLRPVCAQGLAGCSSLRRSTCAATPCAQGLTGCSSLREASVLVIM